MKDIFVIQVKNSEVKALYTPFELQEDYKVSVHDSIKNCIYSYENELKNSQIVIVAEKFSQKLKNEIKLLLNRLYITEKIHYVDYRESFVNYNLLFTKSFKYNRFGLIYQNKDELVLYSALITHHMDELHIKVIDIGFENKGYNDLDNESKDERFSSILPNLLKDDLDVVYLTSKAFNGGYMKNSLEILCTDRRVFLEENLFILGGYSYLKNMYNQNKKIYVKTKYSVGCGAYININGSNGSEKHELFNEHNRFYDDIEPIEIITFNDDVLPIYYGENNRVDVCIAHLVKGINKPTRLSLNISFSDDMQMMIISIIDIGFGLFIKPSNMQVKYFIGIGGR